MHVNDLSQPQVPLFLKTVVLYLVSVLLCYLQSVELGFETTTVVKNLQNSLKIFLYPRPTKLEGGYTGFTLSVCPSVRLSVDDMVSRA